MGGDDFYFKVSPDGSITLEFATLLTLAAADELRLQIWFSAANGLRLRT
jgi:hypothetical protein